MKYFVKDTRNNTRFVLTGLIALIFTIIIGLQAQTLPDEQESKNTESISPSVELVPSGFAVVTATGTDNGAGGGLTIRVVDISQFGVLWTNPANHSPDFVASQVEMPLFQSWTVSNFQNQLMHGLTINSSGTIIYASTSAFLGADRTPNIYKIGPSSTTPALLTTLPGMRGIGSIDLDSQHGRIFASNIEDGRIYRINASTGMINDFFDPFNPDASGTALPPPGERVVAVAYHRPENRLYYSIWGGGVNSIRSIGLTASGAFSSNDKLEFVLDGSKTPAGDIEFNVVGNRMLVAEVPITEIGGFVQLTAHNGRGLEYVKGTSGWKLDSAVYGIGPVKYEIGRHDKHTNTRGGVSWVYSTTVAGGANGFENFVLFTADALLLGPPVYGLQFTPASGGSSGGGLLPSNSIIADLDYDVSQQDKYIYGDVDIRKPTLVISDSTGTVNSDYGIPIRNARLMLSFINNPNLPTITGLTNPFGYFNLGELPIGEQVVVTVSARNYTFSQPSRTFTIGEEFNNLNFVADPQSGGLP